MFTKLIETTTIAANKAVAQTIFEVGQLNPNVQKAEVKDITIYLTSTDTTDRKVSLNAIACDGTSVTLATVDNLQIGTAGAFSITPDIMFNTDQHLNSIRKLQLAISDLTADKAYTSKAIVSYE